MGLAERVKPFRCCSTPCRVGSLDSGNRGLCHGYSISTFQDEIIAVRPRCVSVVSSDTCLNTEVTEAHAGRSNNRLANKHARRLRSVKLFEELGIEIAVCDGAEAGTGDKSGVLSQYSAGVTWRGWSPVFIS